MYGICMEYVWNTYGVCVEYAWNMYGICVEDVWDMFEICMEYAWNTQGTNMPDMATHAGHGHPCLVDQNGPTEATEASSPWDYAETTR